MRVSFYVLGGVPEYNSGEHEQGPPIVVCDLQMRNLRAGG